MTNAIEVKNLTKSYKIFSSGAKRAASALGMRIKHKQFVALDDISCNFKAGEVTAVLGRNGSGKSTLLKLITGVANPTSGSITTNGRISAMLELKSGFNGELTGLENIYYKALTLGIPKDEIERMKDEIVDFADLGIHIDQPFRTYSSGMKARLGFAVASNIDPDILIIDEALSVGDDIFKLKCIAKMNEFRESGKTILFVSHSLSTVKAFCTKGVWLNKGRIMAEGEMGEVVVEYEEFLKVERAKARVKAIEDATNEDIAVSKRDVFAARKLILLDGSGEKVDRIHFGEPLNIRFEYVVKKPVSHLTVAFTITNSEDVVVYSSDKQQHGIDSTLGRRNAMLSLPAVNLIPGKYYLTVEIWDINSSLMIRVKKDVPFNVVQTEYVGTGIAYLDHTVSVQSLPEATK